VTVADREYAAVFSHNEAPCAKQSTTATYEQCIGKEVEFTETHMNAFLAAVRGVVADENGKELELLNKADLAWRDYKKNLCALQYAGFEGGSGAASVQMECVYRTERQYVQQVADAVSLRILAK